MTYSIGFRAPTYQELATQFLIYLQDHSVIEGMYRDPDIRFQSRPGRISSEMLRQAGAALNKIKWRRNDVERFLGIYLTEPKPHVFFTHRHLHDAAQICTQLNMENTAYRKRSMQGEIYFLNGYVSEVGDTASRILKRQIS